MEKIVLRPYQRNGRLHIGLYFTFNTELVNLVRQLPGARWEPVARCWHIPYSDHAYSRLKEQLSGKADLDFAAMDDALNGELPPVSNPGQLVAREPC